MRSVLCLILAIGFCLAAVAQEPPIDEQTGHYLAAAQQAEKEQDYAAASKDYEAILKTHPKMALIRQSLAVTYHLQNKYSEAISEFQQALRMEPTLWGSCLFLGMDLYKSNQFAAAISPLEKSISLNKAMAEPEARFWLGVTYSALDRNEDAERELRRDLDLRPGNLDVLYYLVKVYDRAAAEAFVRVGQMEPQSAAVSLLQAERLLDENRRDVAEVEYRTALELRPDFSGWIPALTASGTDQHAVLDAAINAADAKWDLQFSNLLAQAGDHAQAASSLRELGSQKAANSNAGKVIDEARAHVALEQRSSQPARIADAANILRALSAIREGRFQEAKEALETATQTTHNHILQLLLARCYVESGDFEKAENSLQHLRAVEPNDVDVLLLSGRNDKHEAERMLQQLEKSDPNFYGVHELLARQHEEKTEYDAAIKDYEAALGERPDLAGIRYAIGNLYRKMGQYDEAEKWLTEELARNPYHGLAHYRLGSIYAEQEKPDAAIPHLLQALESHPQLMDAELELGRAYTADGKYPEAVAALTKVSRSEPENDRVHYLLSVAYSKEGRRAEAQTEMAEYQRLSKLRLQHTQQDVKSLANSLDQ